LTLGPRCPSSRPALQPPRLLNRGNKSAARSIGSSEAHRKALHAASEKSGSRAGGGEAPGPGDGGGAAAFEVEGPPPADWSDSDDGADGPVVVALNSFSRRRKGPGLALTGAQRAERSYQRCLVAMHAGAGAVLGSKGELIVGFCGSFRCGDGCGRGQGARAGNGGRQGSPEAFRCRGRPACLQGAGMRPFLQSPFCMPRPVPLGPLQPAGSRGRPSHLRPSGPP
jgi:hypothetical protein